ncbi:hypothetical protein [Lacinutrix salivirga]
MKNKLFLLLFSLFSFLRANAQCAMCRAVLENEVDQTAAKGINDGIIYLMSVPYILVGIIGFVIYKKFSKKTN